MELLGWTWYFKHCIHGRLIFFTEPSSTSIWYVSVSSKGSVKTFEMQAYLSLCWAPIWYVPTYGSVHNIFVLITYTQTPLIKAHAAITRGGNDLNFYLSLHFNPYFVYASCNGSGESAHMCRLTWAFATCWWDKYRNLLHWFIHYDELAFIIFRGGSRISGKGVHMYKWGGGGSLCWSYLIFLKYPMKMK